MAIGVAQIVRQHLRAGSPQRITDDDMFLLHAHTDCKGMNIFRDFYCSSIILSYFCTRLRVIETAGASMSGVLKRPFGLSERRMTIK